MDIVLNYSLAFEMPCIKKILSPVQSLRNKFSSFN
jgi:hypothetical protein